MNMLEAPWFELIFNHQSTPQIVVEAKSSYFTIAAGNPAFLKITKLTKADILGKPVVEVFNNNKKNIKAQELILEGLNNALFTRKVINSEPFSLDILNATGNPQQQKLWQTEYLPLIVADQKIEFLLISVILVEQNLPAKELLLAQREIESQRDRLTRFFMQAPAAICTLDGPEMVFELVNPLYQQFFPLRELLGKPVLEALPEIKDSVWDILLNVYQTGKTFEGKELLIPLARANEGPVEDKFFNFIYQARLSAEQKVDGILVFAFEVTEQVKARKELQKAEESLRMATDSAELGTWRINAQTREFTASPRLKQIFGFDSLDGMTYNEAIDQIREDYRSIVNNAVEESINLGEPFNLEYPITGYYNKKQRWVRSIGKLNYDKDGMPSHMTGVVHDITERKQDDLRKNDFIGMVSHELKTPLTSLNGYVQILQARARNEEDLFSIGALEKVSKQVNKMTALINGFLNVSRLESGKILINKTNFILNDLVKEQIEEARMLAPSFTVNLVPCSPIAVYADLDKIGAVISNLLSNAIKYSPDGKIIEIKCAIENNMAQISVSDHGMGIISKDLDKLFERYYRVDNPKTNTISGFGIGLYLCAEIIQRHNGKIWAESDFGKGSTFFFNLPLGIQ